MRRITHVMFVITLLAVASVCTLGQGALARSGETATGALHAGADVEEILQLERIYDQASIKPTTEDTERLHTDDFMMTARGKVTTRAELLERLKDPNRQRDLIESLNTEDVKVRIYGDTAVTTGRWKRVSRNAEGKDTGATGFFTHVWVRRSKGWQLAVAHYSPIAATANRQ